MNSETAGRDTEKFELTQEQAHSCAYAMIDTLGNASYATVATTHDHIVGWQVCESDQQLKLLIKLATQRDQYELRSLIKSLGFTTLNRQWGYPIPPRCLWESINERRRMIAQNVAVENRLSWVSRPFTIFDRKPRMSHGPAGEFEYCDKSDVIPGRVRFAYRFTHSDEAILNRVWPGYDPMDPPWGFLLAQVKSALETIGHAQSVDDATIRDFNTETVLAVLDKLPSAPKDTTPNAPSFVADLGIQNLAHLVAHRFEVLYTKGHFDCLWPRHLGGAISRVTEQLHAWIPNSPDSLTSLLRLAGIEALDAGMEGDVFPLIESLVEELEVQVSAAESVSKSNLDCFTAGVRPVEVLQPLLAAIDRILWRIDAGLQRSQREKANAQLGAPQSNKSPVHNSPAQLERLDHEELPAGNSTVIETKAIQKTTGYLGIILDESKREVKRKDHLRTISLSEQQAAVFGLFFKAEVDGVSKFMLSNLVEGDEAIRTACKQLRELIGPLGLTISYGTGGNNRVLKEDSQS